jgi:hypothetical protein
MSLNVFKRPHLWLLMFFLTLAPLGHAETIEDFTAEGDLSSDLLARPRFHLSDFKRKLTIKHDAILALQTLLSDFHNLTLLSLWSPTPGAFYPGTLIQNDIQALQTILRAQMGSNGKKLARLFENYFQVALIYLSQFGNFNPTVASQLRDTWMGAGLAIADFINQKDSLRGEQAEQTRQLLTAWTEAQIHAIDEAVPVMKGRVPAPEEEEVEEAEEAGPPRVARLVRPESVVGSDTSYYRAQDLTPAIVAALRR